jgi:competence protein ComEC
MNFWNNNPAFKILTPLVLGIMLSVLFSIKHHFFLVGASILIIPAILLLFNNGFSSRYLKGIVYSALLFCLGVELVIAKTQLNQSNHFSYHIDSNSILEAKLLENFQGKANSNKTVLEIKSVINDTYKTSTQGKILAYFAKDSIGNKLQYGDLILLKARVGEVSRPTNPEQFNYKYYLTLNNINHQVFVNNENYVSLNKSEANFLISFGNKLRDKLYSYLVANGVKGNQLKVASALLLGYREFLDKDLVKSYSSAGAMHVLAVSGLHVGIIFFLLKFTLGFLNRLRFGKYYFVVLILFCLWVYAMMTGFSPSVLRATTMFSFILIGEKLINRKVSIYNTLAVSAIVLLIYNPFLVFEVGFQLSYLAVVGIVYIQPKIYSLFYVPNKLLDKAWNITAVSISAQIATFPLGLYYFHQFPVYFFISNLVVIPAAILIFYLGVFLFITAPFGGISLVLGKVLNTIISVLNWTVKFTEELPYSLVKEIFVNRLETYLLYVLIVSFFMFLHKKRLRILYLCFTVCTVFIGLQFYEKINDSLRKDFTIYSINRSTAFEFSVGNKTYFFSDSVLWNDDSKMLFNIEHNWFKKNISNVVFIDKDSSYHDDEFLYANSGVIYFNGLKTLYLTDNNVFALNTLTPDVIIVSQASLKLLYNPQVIQNLNCTVILDSTIPHYRLPYWQNKLPNCQVFSVSKSFFYRSL